MELGLRGRRAIVTGGSKGIGYAAALELAREGARVAICSRNLEEVRRAAERLSADGGAEVKGFACDVTRDGEVREFFSKAIDFLGGLDILVSNAGGARGGSFASLTDDDFRQDLDVKLFAAMRCCRAAQPHLARSSQPRVVIVNAIAGRQSSPGLFATVTDRGACLAFTKALSDEWASQRILVNSVNVGYVLTPQWERLASRNAPGTSAEDYIARRCEEVPLARAGTPEEVAAAIVFMCSARASYITGASLDVAGGLGRYI